MHSGATGSGPGQGTLRRYVRGSGGPPPAVHGHAPCRGQLANARDLQHPWAVRALGAGRCARPGWEDRRVVAQARTPAGSAAASALARALLPRAVRVRPSAGTRGAGGRALAGGGPAGPRASPGTRPCHSHDAQPPGTASGARPPPPPPPRVGGGRDGLREGGRPAPRRAGPALPSRASHGVPGPGVPAGLRGGCGRQTEGGRGACVRAARRSGPGASWDAGRKAGSWAGFAVQAAAGGLRIGSWLGLVAAMGEGRGPREAPPARAWRLLRPAFLESQRVQVGPSSWFYRMTAPKIDVDQLVGPTTVKTVGVSPALGPSL